MRMGYPFVLLRGTICATNILEGYEHSLYSARVLDESDENYLRTNLEYNCGHQQR